MTLVATPPAPTSAAPAAPAPSVAQTVAQQINSTPNPAKPNTTAAGPPSVPAVTTATSGSPAADQTAGSPAAADPRAAINSLAEQYGFDPSQLAQFNDVPSATAAIRLFIESTAQQGAAFGQQMAMQQPLPYNAPAPIVSPAPVTPAATAAKPLDLKAFGLEDDEPAAKALKALHADNAELRQQMAAMGSRFETIEQANIETAKQRLHAEAAQVVDGFKDQRYGVSTSRTFAQRAAVQQLYNLADDLFRGDVQAGRHPSPLSVRLNRARLIIEQTTGNLAPAPAPQPAQTTIGALPQISSPPSPAAPGMKLTDDWSKNPTLLAKHGGGNNYLG